MPFLVFLGGGKGGKIFWGLPNRFSTNPERIVKVRESAPSKIGFCALSRSYFIFLRVTGVLAGHQYT